MSDLSASKPLHDAKLRLDQIPANGRVIEIEAEADERAAIAARMKVEAVDAFSARMNAKPIKGGIQVKGTLSARVTQLCVVTFVPVTEQIDEDFSRVFLHGRKQDKVPAPGAEVFVDLEGEDLPDYFDGPEVDFTAFLMETLALAIDPYPRADDAQIPQIDDADDPESTSPFAALKQLKSQGD